MARRFKKRRVAAEGVIQQESSWSRRDWLAGLLLLLAVGLAYLPVWWAGFIWDDDILLTANPCIVGPLGLTQIWTTKAADICPLTLTTLWSEYALFGPHPLPYHLTNVLFHGLSAIVLWRVLIALRVPGAWFGAAIWALHPVQAESVAWIAEMKNTQSGLFYLLTILYFIKGLRAQPDDGRFQFNRNSALVLLFAALAIASKSSTVILPVVLCLCAWWIEGRRWTRCLATVLPIFVMCLVAGIISIWTQGASSLTKTDWQVTQSWPERLAVMGDAVWFYLGKLIWPNPLFTGYPKWRIDSGSWPSYMPLAAVFILLLILWRWRHGWSRPFYMGFTYFLAALLPLLGLVDFSFERYSFVADHFQYLASMGPLALAGGIAARSSIFSSSTKAWLAPVLGAGLCLLLGVLTCRQAWFFQSDGQLWAHTVQENPGSWVGYANLGVALVHEGKADEAIGDFRRAIEINPNASDIRTNLGSTLLDHGRIDEAADEFQKAVANDPRNADAHYCLGSIYLNKNLVNEAAVELEQSINLNPYNARAHDALAIVFARQGKVADSVEQSRKALAIDPNYADAYDNLGLTFENNGEFDDAIACYRKSLEINSANASAHYNLGNALFKKGQVDDAISEYQNALRIAPDMSPALDNLGIAFIQKGQPDRASVELEQALKLNPNDDLAQNALSKIKARAK
jgi:tetratricopeptide (TPR) repeat protein